MKGEYIMNIFVMLYVSCLFLITFVTYIEMVYPNEMKTNMECMRESNDAQRKTMVLLEIQYKYHLLHRIEPGANAISIDRLLVQEF